MEVLRKPFNQENGDCGEDISYVYPACEELGTTEIPIRTRVWESKTFDTPEGRKVFSKGDIFATEFDGETHIVKVMGIRKASLDVAFNILNDKGQTQESYAMFFPSVDPVLEADL